MRTPASPQQRKANEGEEAGVRVGLINYPRFPTTFEALQQTAFDLANMLKSRLCQHSYSIVGPAETNWHSDREDRS